MLRVTAIIACLVSFVIGMIVMSLVIRAQEGQLPYCQEDEYLYPLDYKGPGDNVPGDYSCWHFDNTYHD